MSFDNKRYKVFKWLGKLADQKAAYSKKSYNSMPEILTAFGSLYATNSYLLAKVDYPEFEHLSDIEFLAVDEYDENGKHLEIPILKAPIREYERDFLDRHFIENDGEIRADGFLFDPAIMKDALYPFIAHGLFPTMVYTESKCELSAHNSEVSIKVLFMGRKW